MSNCNVDTAGAKALAEMLQTNKTLTILNLETNNISGILLKKNNNNIFLVDLLTRFPFFVGEGIQELFKSLANNQTLIELKLANQVRTHTHTILI
jgi:hypothetical protein